MPGGRAREGSAVGSSRVRAGPGRGLWWCLSGCGSLVNITGGPQAPAHNSARRSLCGPRGRRRKSDPPLGRRKLHSVRRPNRFGSATRRLAGTLVGAGPNEAPSEAPAAGPAPGAGLQSCVRPAEFVRVVPMLCSFGLQPENGAPRRTGAFAGRRSRAQSATRILLRHPPSVRSWVGGSSPHLVVDWWYGRIGVSGATG